MYQLLPILLAGLAFPLSSQTSPTNPTSNPNLNLVIKPADLVRTVYQSNADWIENQYVLPRGHILLSTLQSGSVFILDPNARVPRPQRLVTLGGSTQVLGITSLGSGLYAAIGGNQKSVGFEILNPAVYVFKLDGTLVKSLPGPASGSFLNGLTSLPNKPHIALSTDSIGGKIYRFNTMTNQVTVAVSDPALDPAKDPKAELPLGANGIKIRGDYLFFTNTYKGTFARFKINAYGSKVGRVEVLAQLPLPTGFKNHFDDFAFDHEGNAYIAQAYQTILKVTPRGAKSVVPGTGEPDSKTRNPTSVGFAKDGKSIFVTTGTSTDAAGTFYAGGVFKLPIYGGKGRKGVSI